MTATESQILRDIRAALGREPDVKLWRLSQGGAVSRSGQTYRAGLSVNGASDLIGILRYTEDSGYGSGPMSTGRFIALEVKTDRGRLRREQVLFLELVRRLGGFAAVVRSVDEARAALERARAGASE